MIVVAHGPVSDDENAKWLPTGVLTRDPAQCEFHQAIEYLTVREMTTRAITSSATAELRAVVERAKVKGQALVVPCDFLWRFEAGIRKRAGRTDLRHESEGIATDDRLAQWSGCREDSVPSVRSNGRNAAQADRAEERPHPRFEGKVVDPDGAPVSVPWSKC